VGEPSYGRDECCQVGSTRFDADPRTRMAIATGRYRGAILDELAGARVGRRLVGMASQGRRFPRHGRIELTDDNLVLESWMAITMADIDKVVQEYPDGYGRLAAGGVRGQSPSFGVVRSAGAPLILHLREGPTIALLIDFVWVTGTTKNRHWLTLLGRGPAR
jgi:hypothetical protein